MHVGIITYQRGHLKTWQILRKLLTKPFDVTLYAFPFIDKSQIEWEWSFRDRPYQLINIDIKEFCGRRGIRFVEVGGWDDSDSMSLGGKGDKGTPDVFLTCIAKIIPQSFILDRVIINAHPGLLPENRGIDAFKWCIVNAWPVGVSIHVIDSDIDKGVLLHKIRVPVLPEDTLSDVATRAYKMECDLQSNFDCYLEKLKLNRKVSDEYPLSKKKIPYEIDCRLEEIFVEQRECLVNLSHEKKDI